MYTVDASVWVNGFDQREAGHEISRQFLDAIRLRKVAIEAACTLVSLDGEHLTRLPAVMEVLTPAAALATLTASPNA